MNISGYEFYARIVEHYTSASFEFVHGYNPKEKNFYVMTRNTRSELVILKFKPQSVIFDVSKSDSIEDIVTEIGVLA